MSDTDGDSDNDTFFILDGGSWKRDDDNEEKESGDDEEESCDDEFSSSYEILQNDDDNDNAGDDEEEGDTNEKCEKKENENTFLCSDHRGGNVSEHTLQTILISDSETSDSEEDSSSSSSNHSEEEQLTLKMAHEEKNTEKRKPMERMLLSRGTRSGNLFSSLNKKSLNNKQHQQEEKKGRKEVKKGIRKPIVFHKKGDGEERKLVRRQTFTGGDMESKRRILKKDERKTDLRAMLRKQQDHCLSLTTLVDAPLLQIHDKLGGDNVALPTGQHLKDIPTTTTTDKKMGMFEREYSLSESGERPMLKRSGTEVNEHAMNHSMGELLLHRGGARRMSAVEATTSLTSSSRHHIPRTIISSSSMDDPSTHSPPGSSRSAREKLYLKFLSTTDFKADSDTDGGSVRKSRSARYPSKENLGPFALRSELSFMVRGHETKPSHKPRQPPLNLRTSGPLLLPGMTPSTRPSSLKVGPLSRVHESTRVKRRASITEPRLSAVTRRGGSHRMRSRKIAIEETACNTTYPQPPLTHIQHPYSNDQQHKTEMTYPPGAGVGVFPSTHTEKQDGELSHYQKPVTPLINIQEESCVSSVSAQSTSNTFSSLASTHAPILASEVYVCVHCRREIFKGSKVVCIKQIWFMDGYAVHCYVLSELQSLPALRRYDVHQHQGWYCCGFIAMRMTTDKFGVGVDKFLVFRSDVVASSKYVEHRRTNKRARYTPDDIGHANYARCLKYGVKNKLVVVLFCANWCPASRWMQHLLTEIKRAEEAKVTMDALRENDTDTDEEEGEEGEDDDDKEPTQRMKISCFKVDIDKEVEFFEEWNNQGVPFIVFYFNGRQVIMKKAVEHRGGWGCLHTDNPLYQLLHKTRFQIGDGGILGALKAPTMSTIVHKTQSALLKGIYEVHI